MSSAAQTWAPYAVTAGKELGMDPAFILAQWMYETGNGTNLGSTKYNNLAGIKSAPNASKGIFDPSDSQHAGYTSLSAFTQDYVRVMKLSYYDNVRKVAKTGATPTAELKAINDSPWAVADYNQSGFLNYYKQAASALGAKVTGADISNIAGIDIMGGLDGVNMDNIQAFVKDKWYIVAGALVIIAILKR